MRVSRHGSVNRINDAVKFERELKEVACSKYVWQESQRVYSLSLIMTKFSTQQRVCFRVVKV